MTWHDLWVIWTWIAPFVLITMGANSIRRIRNEWGTMSKFSKITFTWGTIWLPLGLLYLTGQIYLAVNS